MLQTAHIINIVNIFDKEYSTAQIYWVLPYQVIMIKHKFKCKYKLVHEIQIQAHRKLIIQIQNTDTNTIPNTKFSRFCTSKVTRVRLTRKGTQLRCRPSLRSSQGVFVIGIIAIIVK